MAGPQQLVSCQWLKAKMDAKDTKGLVLLDVSWSSQEDCFQLFQKEHLAGAQYLNVMEGPHTELLPRNLPDPETFQEKARAVGVGQKSKVIVYARGDLAGFFMAGRAWWTFRVFGHEDVAVLNGGLERWKALGFPLTTDVSPAEPGDFTVHRSDTFYMTFEQAQQAVTSGNAQVLDSRDPGTYSNPGHIKGAKNVFVKNFLDPKTQEMKPVGEVKKVLSEAGVDLGKPIVAYCNSGMSSSTLLLVTQLCGASNASLYHGGFTEWKSRASADMIEK